MASIVRMHIPHVLLAVPLSYAQLIFIVFIGRWLGLTTEHIAQIVVISILILLFVFIARKYSIHLPKTRRGNQEQHYWIGIIGALIVVTLYSIFCSVTGNYNEIPSDLYIHQEIFGKVFEDIATGQINEIAKISDIVGKSGRYWYYVHALLTKFSGVSHADSVRYAASLNALVLLIAVFSLAFTLLDKLVNLCIGRLFVALTVSVLFVLHFGINVFSFIRYYAFAPTALNLVIYFAAISIFIRFTYERGISIRYLLLLLVFILTAAMVHVQETVFIVVLGLLMLSYVLLARKFRFAGEVFLASEDESNEFYFSNGGIDRMIPHGWLVITGIFFLVIAYFWSHYFIETSTPQPDNKLVFFGSIIPALKSWYVLNPTYQFFRVVTPWGLLVYVLFFWHWKDFRGNPFLVAGMLSPLFTVFNPYFVDLFLRHTTYITLWRFCYMIPLVFVAGYLFYKAFTRFRESTMVGKFGYGLMVASLVALLFPIQVGSISVPYSRMQTLMPVKKENSPEHWADLLDYLETLPKREQILTDPVTGYFVSALTKHHSPRYKFFKLRYKQFNFNSYTDKPLAKYRNWLVIVNQRDGGHSRTGELSRHWSADILKVSRQYKPQLVAHLKDNPERFTELWATQDIKVYRVLK